MTIDLILIGLAITLEPLPLTAYLLLISAPGAGRRGLGFLLGWLITLVGVVVLTIALTGGKPLKSGTGPSTAALVAKIVLGVLLLWLAWRQRARRERPKSRPRWMAKVDHMGFAGAAVLAFLLQPWGMVAAGAATVASADLSHATTVLTLVAFCALATASYLVMQVYATFWPGSARLRLTNLNDWIISHQDEVIIVVSAGLGVWLIGHSVYLLTR